MSIERWSRYVAVGDSFTEGLWDFAAHPAGTPDRYAPAALAPDADLPLVGWADRLATGLSARRVQVGLPPLEYANLAVRGKLLRPIVVEQVPAALAMAPDLVSLVGGGNDLLRLDGDPDRLARRLEAAVVRLRAAGADVLLGTGMDTVGTPLVRHQRGKVAVLNAHVWSIARRHGAYVVDLWGMRSLQDWQMWAQDRIHLTTAGHRRVAQGALVGLGLQPDSPDWDDPAVTPPPVGAVDRWRDDAAWARAHVAPWVGRHLRGHSSGDGRAGKQPAPVPVG